MKSPAFSFYVRDWLCSKTVSKFHSKPGSRGVSAYLYLLCSAWLEDPPATLPNDLDQLATYARVSRQEFDEIWADLKSQFVLNSEGKWVNERLMQEWQKQEKRKSAGSKGGSKKVANRVAALENENANESTSEIPSEDQAIAATMSAGIPAEFCRYVYAAWCSRSGKDAAGVAVKWLPYVTGRWAKERNEWQNGTHRAKQQGTHGTPRNNNRQSPDRAAGTFNERKPGEPSKYAGREKLV